MAVKAWYALVTFMADTPDEDMAADELANRFTTDLERAVNYLNGVETYSTRVEELDSYDEARWEPQSRLAPL